MNACNDDGRPVVDVICTVCNSRVSLFADGRPFTTIGQARAFIFAWLRGKACECRKDDNHLRDLTVRELRAVFPESKT